MNMPVIQGMLPGVSSLPSPRTNSAGAQTFDALNDVFDLSRPSRLLSMDIPPEEQESFLKLLATLLQQGIIGTETRDLNGQSRQSFISTSFADPQFRSAPPTPSTIDLRA